MMRKYDTGRRVYRKKSWYEKHEATIYGFGCVILSCIAITMVIIHL